MYDEQTVNKRQKKDTQLCELLDEVRRGVCLRYVSKFWKRHLSRAQLPKFEEVMQSGELVQSGECYTKGMCNIQ